MKFEPRYPPTKLIFTGDGIPEPKSLNFVETQVGEYLRGVNETSPETILVDPVFVQAKGAAELVRRRLYLETPQRPYGDTGKGTASEELIDL